MRSDDVNTKGIAIFIGILAVTVAFCYGATELAWRHFEKRARRSDEQIIRQGPAAAAIATRPYFPQPREQPNPMLDLEAVRAREEKESHTYGWVDRGNGIVRIPIERAMDLVVEQQKGNP